MRRTLGMLAVVALASAGIFACDATPGISDVQLGFTISEGVLQVQEGDPTVGSIILSSTAGNCPTYQLGASVRNILLTDALVFILQAAQADDGGYLPLTQGNYTVVMGYVPDAGNIALVNEYETTPVCQVTPTGGNSGTITLDPFNPSAGGTSDVSYSIVFGNSRFTGANALQTCVIPANAPEPDAGACYLPGGGGPT